MLWMNLSSAQSILIQQSLFNIVAVLVSSISVHLIYLLFNFGIVKLMKLPTHEGIAVLIMSSQKSAAVAINIISYITQNSQEKGLYAIPCMIGQLTQLFVGSYLANHLEKIV